MTQTEPLRIDVSDARRRVERGEAIVLDMLSPDAWDQAEVAVAGAVRMAPNELEAHLAELPTDRALIAYCT